MHDSITPSKKCKACGIEKPYYEFAKHPRFKDGRQSTCKQCRTTKYGGNYKPGVPDGYRRCGCCGNVYEATLEHFLPQKRYNYGLDSTCRNCRNEKSREKRRAQGIPARESNAVGDDHKRCTQCKRVFPATKQYFNLLKHGLFGLHALCRECFNSKQTPRILAAKYNDPERWRRRQRRYQQKSRIRGNVRRARRLSLPDTFTVDQWNNCLEWWGNCCAYCGNQQGLWNPMCADHFVAIATDGCPGTTADNMIPACKSCNSSKSDRDAATWLEKRYGKRKAARILRRVEQYFDWVKSHQ